MSAARAPLMSFARRSARSLVQQHQPRVGAVSSSCAAAGQRRLLAGAVTGWNASALAVLGGKATMASYPPAWASLNANLPSNRSVGAAAPTQDEEEDNTSTAASSSSRGPTSCEVSGEDADEPVGVARASEDTAKKKTFSWRGSNSRKMDC
jgi:hypothetical protein